MVNPFYLYSIAGLAMLCLYSFGWSELYQGLSVTTAFVLFVVFSTSLVLGKIANFKYKKLYRLYSAPYRIPKLSRYPFLILCFFIAVDFFFAGTIPVLKVLSASGYEKTDVRFLPVVHTFIIIGAVYYAQYVFHHYLKSKKKTSLLIFLLIGVIYPILLGGRGILFVNIASSMVAYFIIRRKHISFGLIAKSLLIVSVLGFIFGLLGEVRSANSKARKATDISQTLIEQIAKPTERFEAMGINPNFLWPYIYVVSPLGNLDNLFKSRKIFENDLRFYFVSNYFPNFLQKYFVEEKINKDKSNLVVDVFNTYTAFGKSYQQLHWLGVSLYFIFVLFIIFALSLIARPEPSSIIMLQFLTVGHVLSWFSNLYVKEIVIGPVLVGLAVLLYRHLTKKVVEVV